MDDAGSAQLAKVLSEDYESNAGDYASLYVKDLVEMCIRDSPVGDHHTGIDGGSYFVLRCYNGAADRFVGLLGLRLQTVDIISHGTSSCAFFLHVTRF